MSIEDARATVEHMILDAIAGTAHISGLTPDRSEVLINAIVAAVRSPYSAWAFAELAGGVQLDGNEKRLLVLTLSDTAAHRPLAQIVDLFPLMTLGDLERLMVRVSQKLEGTAL